MEKIKSKNFRKQTLLLVGFAYDQQMVSVPCHFYQK